jgi:hypothetical protein
MRVLFLLSKRQFWLQFKLVIPALPCPERCRSRNGLVQLQWQYSTFQMKDEMLTDSDNGKQVDILMLNNLRKYYHGILCIIAGPLQP